jgi:hypothetical protein
VLAAAEAALVGLLGSFAGQMKEVYGDGVLYQVRCGLEFLVTCCISVMCIRAPAWLLWLSGCGLNMLCLLGHFGLLGRWGAAQDR